MTEGHAAMTTAVPPGAAADLASYYDLDLQDEPGDLDLYRALAARTGGPILELAVGSGRLAVPLAAAGFEVVGVDLDGAMLERATRRWAEASAQGPKASGTGSLELIQADLAEVELGPRFGLAILALNSLLLLGEPGRQLAALQALARHLRPDGVAAIDVWLPGADDLALYDGRLIVEWTRRDTETGDLVAKLGSALYDAATSSVDLQQIFDAWPEGGGPVRRVARRDRLRLVGADELRRMAADAGLAVEALGADHELTPFGPGAERAVLIGRLV